MEMHLLCFLFSFLCFCWGQSITPTKENAIIEQQILENIRRPVLLLVQAYLDNSKRDLDAITDAIATNDIRITEAMEFKSRMENTSLSNGFEKQMASLNESLTSMINLNIQRSMRQMTENSITEKALLLLKLNETLESKMNVTEMNVRKLQTISEDNQEELARLSNKRQGDIEAIDMKIGEIKKRFEISTRDLETSLLQNMTRFQNELIKNAKTEFDRGQALLADNITDRLQHFNVTLRDYMVNGFEVFSDNIKAEVNYEKVIDGVKQMSQRIQNETQDIWRMVQSDFNATLHATIALYFQNMSQFSKSQRNSLEHVQRQLRGEQIKTSELANQMNVTEMNVRKLQTIYENQISNLTGKIAEMSIAMVDVKTMQQNYEKRIDELQKSNQETKRKLEVISGNITELLDKDVEEATPLTDCGAIYREGERTSGVYRISPDGSDPFSVYCDMTDGGWTLLQRRVDGSQDFKRPWSEYVRGFGNLSSEFWLGLEYMHRLTVLPKKVKFELQLTSGPWKNVLYSIFQVHDSSHSYSLHVAGHVSGLKPRTFIYNNGHNFWTHDRDNRNKCATKRNGGWWYDNCTYLNINGKYNLTNSESGMTEHCCSQTYNNLKATIMKIQ